jgi:hypothetical protein
MLFQCRLRLRLAPWSVSSLAMPAGAKSALVEIARRADEANPALLQDAAGE